MAALHQRLATESEDWRRPSVPERDGRSSKCTRMSQCDSFVRSATVAQHWDNAQVDWKPTRRRRWLSIWIGRRRRRRRDSSDTGDNLTPGAFKSVRPALIKSSSVIGRANSAERRRYRRVVDGNRPSAPEIPRCIAINMFNFTVHGLPVYAEHKLFGYYPSHII